MEQRLQKIIADSGLCARRKAEELIRQGRVRLNGNTARLGDTADLSLDDVITVDGVAIKTPKAHLTVMLNKPRGYVTTAQDEKGRKTVLSLLPQDSPRLYPVGRLDMYSEGLLLLTNDGALAQKLTHPSQQIHKAYHLWVSNYTPGAEKTLARPIVLDGKPIAPPQVELLHEEEKHAMLCVTIHEGRNRQIRRMCQAAGLICTRLKRVREGELCLGDLRPGQYRLLTYEEQEYLNGL